MRLGRRTGQGMLRSRCRKARSRPWRVYLISWCHTQTLSHATTPFIDHHAQDKSNQTTCMHSCRVVLVHIVTFLHPLCNHSCLAQPFKPQYYKMSNMVAYRRTVRLITRTRIIERWLGSSASSASALPCYRFPQLDQHSTHTFTNCMSTIDITPAAFLRK